MLSSNSPSATAFLSISKAFSNSFKLLASMPVLPLAISNRLLPYLISNTRIIFLKQLVLV